MVSYNWDETIKNDLDNFKKNITYICKDRNITIGGLEDAANISRGYISRINGSADRNQKKVPGLDKAIVIARILQVRIDDLLSANLASNPNSLEAKTLAFINKITEYSEKEKITWEQTSDIATDKNNFNINENDEIIEIKDRYKAIRGKNTYFMYTVVINRKIGIEEIDKRREHRINLTVFYIINDKGIISPIYDYAGFLKHDFFTFPKILEALHRLHQCVIDIHSSELNRVRQFAIKEMDDFLNEV